ncbi:LysE/ArgO family amino acid transporter [Microvirga makkahensis]|uniref:LysE family transporter n=1 Tax=Microvirga makkahensis TaxID=1128670 RepID=A0A7X3MT08_9HYPH|nr:LysE/ArgO family amino acid transporter [Microvirga makkahensis]MXQ12684.1 LysE family transporter [Microvirga makkahensis]
MTASLIAGFLLGISLILPIGAQNAFVLRVGLRGEHVWAVCLTCALSDAVLILAGVSGLSRVTAAMPWAETTLLYFGAAFLLAYGARSFRDAFRSAALRPSEAAPAGMKRAVLTCLALTWLNPHVYLDTVVLIGSISTQFAQGKEGFAIGAMLASFTFFFSLGYGARLLKPFFANPATWRVLDVVIGLIMWATAARLLLNGG